MALDTLPTLLPELTTRARGPAGLKSVAFDLSAWHSGSSCVRTFVPGIGGIGVKICCGPCGILCDVEATGCRITVMSSFSAAAVGPGG